MRQSIKNIGLIFCLLLFFSFDVAIAEGERIKESSVGLGVGLPYGMVGGNIDIKIAPNLNLSAGGGSTLGAGFGYNLGLKYFLTSADQLFRPRLSAFYGTTRITSLRSYKGISFSLGAQCMWGQSMAHGFDIDIVFIASCEWDVLNLIDAGVLKEEPNNTSVSIGYRYAFN